MQEQSWNPERYARNARFVAELGMPVVALLDPQPGERILDLGCGDGALTKTLRELGCEVVGVDASAEQVEAAQQLGLDARVMDARRLDFDASFDAVFSNAALHWVRGADDVIAGVRRALKPGGRFVGEFGGAGNVARIVEALSEALEQRGIAAAEVNPWYFPSPDEYLAQLEAHGFMVRSIELIPRPTPVPTGITGWLETFGESFVAAVAADRQADFLKDVEETLRPVLCGEDGVWIVDYVRLRFAADTTALSRAE